MTTRNKIIIIVIALLTSFAVGRYTVPTKVKIETKVVEVERKTDVKNTTVKKDRKKKIIILETKKPDGESTKTTTITDDTASSNQTAAKQTEDSSKQSDTSKEVTHASDKVTVSALAGYNLFGNNNAIQPFNYGLSVTKPVLGPITFGLFGFQSGLVGASLGLTF